MHLHTIIGSTRPGRVGKAIASWFHEEAQRHGKFECALVDLADFDLPVFNEPHHPKLLRYQHAHTKAWSESVRSADAFVFVTPEYNYSPSPALLNALDYLYAEWNYKPATFVSYGGISAGLRAVQIERLMLIGLKMVPIPEQIPISAVSSQLGEDGSFNATKLHCQSAMAALNELHKLAQVLKPLRSS